MRYNLGAGDKAPLFPSPPWFNMDIEPGENIQETVDLRESLGSMNDAELVMISHYLEHLPYLDAHHFLVRVKEKMQNKAAIVIVGPDCEKANAMYQAGDPAMTPELWHAVHKHGEIPATGSCGDVHAWNCNTKKVLSLLSSAGYSDAKEISFTLLGKAGIPVVNPSSWQTVCVARR